MAREHVHLIGIGGTGMTALAGLLHESGCRVTGSDGALYPPTSTLLETMGLEVREGFDPQNVDPHPDLIVVGNAIARGNPELEAVLDLDMEYTSMPRLLARRFLRTRHSIVVAGTHGKTTTASMLACVLDHAGRDPGFLIGGSPLNFELPYRVGSGPAFVIEGDEYDTAFFDKGPKFMHYRPDTALIGTVEFDHADIYRDLDQVKQAFKRLVLLVPGRGLIVRHEESSITREVTADALCRVEGYGSDAGIWRADEIEETAEGTTFRVTRDGETLFSTRLVLSGMHNVRNALAVTAAAHEQGLSGDEIGAGLAAFRGVRRRLELRGVADDVRVFDDFAHHPTAIRETLTAVRRRFDGRDVWAVFEPRSWSMRRNIFQDRLPEAFEAADRTVVAGVYAADAIPDGERLDPERLVADVAGLGSRAVHLPDVEAILDHLREQVDPGAVVVVMSNGGFEGLHGRLLEALEGRAASRAQGSSPVA
ncbi:MAG: UDP-N-acetylmuramate:L-alanyl-gamma-D-glutamyl-meso-diaminopimelate ligase [bacterium]|nr:UDP-N-acetylmuramate:L-alanyl-gamma-D-glutamyl-meso-diaminopimelate ligase [bacterium]